jgi:hypothetical protein
MTDESMQVADILGVDRPQGGCHSETLQVREQGSVFRRTVQVANETRNEDPARTVPYLAMRRGI